MRRIAGPWISNLTSKVLVMDVGFTNSTPPEGCPWIARLNLRNVSG